MPAAMISGTRVDTPGEETRIRHIQATYEALSERPNDRRKQRVTRTTDTQQGRRVDWRAHQNNVSSVVSSSRCGRAAFTACADMSPLLWPTWHRSAANMPRMLHFLVCLPRADATEHNCCHFFFERSAYLIHVSHLSRQFTRGGSNSSD